MHECSPFWQHLHVVLCWSSPDLAIMADIVSQIVNPTFLGNVSVPESALTGPKKGKGKPAKSGATSHVDMSLDEIIEEGKQQKKKASAKKGGAGGKKKAAPKKGGSNKGASN